MWALGCCLYEMMELKHVFDADNMNGLVIKIVRASVGSERSFASLQK
jgi:NIMA (never in mitosis gene a)-related kinase